MSKTIDERVVSMQFDNQKFEKNIEKTITSLENLDNTINDFGSKGEDAFINLQDGLSRTELVFKGFYEKIGGYLGDLIIKAGEFVKSMSFDQVIAGFQKYSAETNAAQTIVANVGSSVEDTYAALDNIADYTDKTSYHYENLVQTAARFAQTGVDLDDAVEAVKGIGNWAALSGAGIEKADYAMSALSKSIGKGYVQLTEWNTISKVANMDSRQFIETVIETARTTSAAFRRYEAINGQITAQNFTTEMFGNNHLFTSDILLATLKRYSDEEDEIGKSAYAAASEAKNLGEAIGAVKDAVSSGWSLSFRYLFGNYDEARKFWTFVQDCMLDIFTIGIDFRNEVLEKWHVSEVGGWQDMFDALKSLWAAIQNLAEPIGNAFQTIFQFDVDDSVKKLTDLTTKFKDAAEAFELLTGAWKNRDALDEYIKSLSRLDQKKLGKAAFSHVKIGGELGDIQKDLEVVRESEKLRVDIYDSFRGIFSVVDIAKNAIGEFFIAFKDAFSGIGEIGRSFLSFTAGLGNFLSTIQFATKETDFFSRVFSALGKVVKAVVTPIFKAISKVFETLGEKLEILSYDENGAIDFFEKLASGIEAVSKFLIDKGIIPAFELLGDAIFAVTEFLKPFVKIIGEKLTDAFSRLKGFFDDIQDKTTSTGKKFDDLKERTKKLWSEFKENKLEPIKNAVENVFGDIDKFVSGAIENIKGLFSKKDNEGSDAGTSFILEAWGKVLDVLEKVYHFLDDNLSDAFDWISDKAKKLKDNMEPLSGVFDTVKDALKRFFDQFKKGDEDGSISLFERIGGGISTLLQTVLDIVSVFIDWIKETFSGQDLAGIIDIIIKLLEGLIALKVGQLVGNLSDIAGGIAGLTDQFKKAKKATDSIKDVAISLLLLAASVAVLSTIDPSKMANSLNAIAELITELMVAFASMNAINIGSTGANSTTGLLGNNIQILTATITTKMIDLAAAVLILTVALQRISKLDYDSLEKGLLGLFGIMTSLGIFAKLASKSEILSNSKSLKGFANGISTMLLSLAASLIIVSLAIKMLSGIEDPSRMWQSVAGVAAVIVFLAGFTKAVNGSNTQKAAVTLLALAAAIGIVSIAIAALSALPDIGKVAITTGLIAALIIALGGAIRLMGDEATLAGAAGIIVIALALAILTPVIAALGALPFDQVGQGLLTIVVALAAFAITGVIMKTAGDGLLKFGEALLMISGSVALLGIGLVALAAGIAALGAVVTVFGESLIAAFGELLPKIVDALLYGITYILEQLVLAAPLFAVLGVAIITEFGAALALQFDALVGTAIAMLISLINSLANAIDEHADEIGDAVLRLIFALLKLVGGLVANIGNLIMQFFGMEKVDTGNWFTDILGIVVQGLAGILYKVIEGLGWILSQGVKFLGLLPLYLIKGLLELLGINTEFIDNIIADITTFFDDAWNLLVNALKDIWNKVTGWFKGLWDKIKGIFKGKDKDTGDLAESAEEGMERVTDAMDKGLDEDKVEQSAVDVSTATIDGLNQDGKAPEQAEEVSEEIFSSYTEPLEDGIDEMEDLGGDLFGAFSGSFDLNSTGVTDLFSSGEGITTGLLDSFNLNGKGDDEAYGVGDDLSKGYENGILGNLTGVWNAASRVAQTAINALAKTQQSNSPSKITDKLGGYFSLGFSEGITDGTSDVVNSAQDMGSAAIDVLKSSLSGLDFETDTLTNPVITPVLDLSEIQNGDRAIQNMLSGQHNIGFLGSIGAYGTGTIQAAGNTETTINMTINGAVGQDVNELADVISRRLNQQLRSRERVWA